MSSAAGQVSPISAGITGSRTHSRESAVGAASLVKNSPTSVPSGFRSDSKSPSRSYDDNYRQLPMFKAEFPTHFRYRFEDRITGHSLIPKGDPMEARLQEILRWGNRKKRHFFVSLNERRELRLEWETKYDLTYSSFYINFKWES